jgi:hypothetical protein
MLPYIVCVKQIIQTEIKSFKYRLHQPKLNMCLLLKQYEVIQLLRFIASHTFCNHMKNYLLFLDYTPAFLTENNKVGM